MTSSGPDWTVRTAERRARIEFGGHGRFKEECQDALGGNWVEGLLQDLRFSVRVLRKSPGFTLVTILTLALAIGANAVVFGLLNAVILRPLNVPKAESLYGIQHGNVASSYESYPDYLDLRDRNRSFDGLAAYSIVEAGLDTGENKVLSILAQGGEPFRSTPGRLAARMELSSGAMTNRLDRLEQAGLIRRLPDATDRRGVVVELTEHGHDVYRSTVGVQAKKEQLFASALTARQRTELNALLRRLMREFERREQGPADDC